MIDMFCCGRAQARLEEHRVGQTIQCATCGRTLLAVAGEELFDGMGDGDFDAVLNLPAQGEFAPASILLGGTADITIGRAEHNNILLDGKFVSHDHCRLRRVDFNPSRWLLIDNNSSNGTFIHGQAVLQQELTDGDPIRIGELQLSYNCHPVQSVASAHLSAALGKTVPSSGNMLPVSGAFSEHSSNTSAHVPKAPNNIAVAGLIVSLFICFPLASLAGVILSCFGLARARKHGGANKGVAIAGIIVGLAGLAFQLILFTSAILPAAQESRKEANRLECAQNMRLIGSAIVRYMHAHDQAFPDSLETLVADQELPSHLLKCPAESWGSGNYILPSATEYQQTGVVLYEPMSNHENGFNVLWHTGDVSFYHDTKGAELMAQLAQPYESQGWTRFHVPVDPLTVPHAELPFSLPPPQPPPVPPPSPLDSSRKIGEEMLRQLVWGSQIGQPSPLFSQIPARSSSHDWSLPDYSHPGALKGTLIQLTDDDKSAIAALKANWKESRPGTDLLEEMQPSVGEIDANHAERLSEWHGLTTTKKLKPPLTLKMILRTDGKDFRIGYGVGQIIFNWEMKPTELRIDGGPTSAGGSYPKPDVGSVPAGQWSTIEYAVTPSSATVMVNGKEIQCVKDDFSAIDELFTIESHGGQLDVQSVRVVPGE